MMRGSIWLRCLGVPALVLGCSRATPTANVATEKAAPPVAAQPAFDPDSGPFAAGKNVLVANGCFRCHTINGVRGPVVSGGRGGRGPDLGKTGGKEGHTPEWLAEHVRDPKAHKPESRMPAFKGKIGEQDLEALAEY